VKVLRLLEVFDRSLAILVRTNLLSVVLNRSIFVSGLKRNILDWNIISDCADDLIRSKANIGITSS